MKCNHKWEPVNICREKEYQFPKEGYIGDKESYVIYKDWIVTLICQKCKKIKTEKYKND